MDNKRINLNIAIAILLTSTILLAWSINKYSSEITDLMNAPIKVYKEHRVRQTTTSTTLVQLTTTSVFQVSSTTTTIRPESIQCMQHADCGINGTYTLREHTCYQGGIYRQYIAYRCENPNSTAARCVGSERRDFIRQCGRSEACVEGETLCAYEGPLDQTKSPWKLPGSNIIPVSSADETVYSGYSFKAVYVFSQNSRPEGLTIDVIKPNGEESWEYLRFEKGTVIGNITAGLSELSKEGR
jgi:hypothetical protein